MGSGLMVYDLVAQMALHYYLVASTICLSVITRRKHVQQPIQTLEEYDDLTKIRDWYFAAASATYALDGFAKAYQDW